jgi:hypothetical protein
LYQKDYPPLRLLKINYVQYTINLSNMKLAIASILASTAAAFTTSSFNGVAVNSGVSSSSSLKMESLADLSTLAKKLNPLVPRFDPLGLSTSSFWGTSEESTIGFLRESEVKHGRIAMFAFVGYIVHANQITWPWPMMLDGTPFPKVTSAPEAWDAIPDSAKLQIFAFIGFLEYVSYGDTYHAYMQCHSWLLCFALL